MRLGRVALLSIVSQQLLLHARALHGRFNTTVSSCSVSQFKTGKWKRRTRADTDSDADLDSDSAK